MSLWHVQAQQNGGGWADEGTALGGLDLQAETQALMCCPTPASLGADAFNTCSMYAFVCRMLLCAVCCVLYAAICYVLCAVCCMVYGVYCILYAVCCMAYGVCCILYAVRHYCCMSLY